MHTLPSGRVRFGAFELDLGTGELRSIEAPDPDNPGPNNKVLLREQVFQVLRMLVEREGKIVNREEIKTRLWVNDTVVDFDQSINATIKALRRALGDSADNPRYIETLGRRGYRLMLTIEYLKSAPGTALEKEREQREQSAAGMSHNGGRIQRETRSSWWTAAVVSQGSEQLIAATRLRKKKVFWATGAAILLGAAFAGLMLSRHATTLSTAFDLFWGPVLENPRPVLICAGTNSVYVLTPKAIEKYKATHSQRQYSAPNLETLFTLEELRNFSGDDFRPVKDRFLTNGDASAMAQISSLLASRHHPYDLRFGSDLAFGDLRHSSAILIGAFNNSWTLNMTDNLRFIYDSGDSPLKIHVQDRFDTSRSWWPKFPCERDGEDYAIVSRILDSKTGSVLVTIAGICQSGTQAAGEFTTSPDLIAEFTKQAPKNWSRKNLQIVLHTNVVNDIPGLPTVAASYYW